MIAYMVTNLVNGKRYIGITTRTVAERWHAHVKESRYNSRRPFLRAISKYGVEAFKIEEIACAPCRDDLMALEMILIQQENTLSCNGFGYNATLGGEGTSGYAFSDEQRAAMSEIHKARTDPHMMRMRAGLCLGKKHSPERIAAQVILSTGRTHSTETKAKLSAIRSEIVGWTHTPETRAKISASHTGKERTPEHCAALSIAAKTRPRRPHTAETKAKISASNKATAEAIPRIRKPHSAETKAKMSISAKAFCAARNKSLTISMEF